MNDCRIPFFRELLKHTTLQSHVLPSEESSVRLVNAAPLEICSTLSSRPVQIQILREQIVHNRVIELASETWCINNTGNKNICTKQVSVELESKPSSCQKVR